MKKKVIFVYGEICLVVLLLIIMLEKMAATELYCFNYYNGSFPDRAYIFKVIAIPILWMIVGIVAGVVMKNVWKCKTRSISRLIKCILMGVIVCYLCSMVCVNVFMYWGFYWGFEAMVGTFPYYIYVISSKIFFFALHHRWIINTGMIIGGMFVSW